MSANAKCMSKGSDKMTYLRQIGATITETNKPMEKRIGGTLFTTHE